MKNLTIRIKWSLNLFKLIPHIYKYSIKSTVIGKIRCVIVYVISPFLAPKEEVEYFRKQRYFMKKEEIIKMIIKNKWKIITFLSKPLNDYELSELKILAELLYETNKGSTL